MLNKTGVIHKEHEPDWSQRTLCYLIVCGMHHQTQSRTKLFSHVAGSGHARLPKSLFLPARLWQDYQIPSLASQTLARLPNPASMCGCTIFTRSETRSTFRWKLEGGLGSRVDHTFSLFCESYSLQDYSGHSHERE